MHDLTFGIRKVLRLSSDQVSDYAISALFDLIDTDGSKVCSAPAATSGSAPTPFFAGGIGLGMVGYLNRVLRPCAHPPQGFFVPWFAFAFFDLFRYSR